MDKEKKSPAAAKILLIVAAVALAAALLISVYFLFIKNKPLETAAVGKWKVIQDGSTIVGKTERSMFAALGIEITEAQKVPSDVREYLLLTEDGKYSVTVDHGDLIGILNRAVDAIITYYVEHPTEFIEKIGLGEEYDGDGSDLSGEKIKQFLNAKMNPIRGDIAKFGEEDYFFDDDGNIIVSEGTYTVSDDRIDFNVDPERTLIGMYGDENYVVASASSKKMTVKECAFYALNLKADTEMEKIK